MKAENWFQLRIVGVTVTRARVGPTLFLSKSGQPGVSGKTGSIQFDEL